MKLEKFRPSFLDKAQGWLQIVMMIAYLVCLGVVLYLLGAVTAFVWVTGIKLFIIFITTHRGKVISLGIKEEIVYKDLRTFNKRRFAGTKFLINFLKCFIAKSRTVLYCKRSRVVLFKCSGKRCFFTEH